MVHARSSLTGFLCSGTVALEGHVISFDKSLEPVVLHALAGFPTLAHFANMLRMSCCLTREQSVTVRCCAW